MVMRKVLQPRNQALVGSQLVVLQEHQAVTEFTA